MQKIMYVYKEDDLIVEVLYHKKRLMSVISELGCFGGNTHIDVTDQKYLQRLMMLNC